MQGGFHGKSAVAFWSARVRRGACRREQLEAEWQRGRAAGAAIPIGNPLYEAPGGLKKSGP